MALLRLLLNKNVVAFAIDLHYRLGAHIPIVINKEMASAQCRYRADEPSRTSNRRPGE
jgi:hypothetical protein